MVWLTREEEEILKGAKGEGLAEALEAVVKVAEVLGAPRLIKVVSAHISGISYRNLGVEGIEYLEELAEKGLRFAVPTTINPAGFDMERYGEMRVGVREYELQMRALKALAKMGAQATLSCTPYLIYPPRFGDHLAWAESSAVLYANSVLGARSNREGGPFSVLEALVGRAPYVGLHTDEARKPSVVLDLGRIRDFVEAGRSYSALGYLVGKVVRRGVPALHDPPAGLKEPGNLRLFLSAVGASSSIGMVLIEGVSPEFTLSEGLERIEPEVSDLTEILESWRCEDFDAAVLGCPHLSPDELLDLANRLKGRTLRKPLFVFTSRWSAVVARAAVEKLRSMGVRVYSDTCMVVGNLSALGVHRCATDSAKAAYYLSSQGYKVALMPREALLEYVAG